jgi:hypothetical protein
MPLPTAETAQPPPPLAALPGTGGAVFFRMLNLTGWQATWKKRPPRSWPPRRRSTRRWCWTCRRRPTAPPEPSRRPPRGGGSEGVRETHLEMPPWRLVQLVCRVGLQKSNIFSNPLAKVMTLTARFLRLLAAARAAGARSALSPGRTRCPALRTLKAPRWRLQAVLLAAPRRHPRQLVHLRPARGSAGSGSARRAQPRHTLPSAAHAATPRQQRPRPPMLHPSRRHGLLAQPTPGVHAAPRRGRPGSARRTHRPANSLSRATPHAAAARAAVRSPADQEQKLVSPVCARTHSQRAQAVRRRVRGKCGSSPKSKLNSA